MLTVGLNETIITVAVVLWVAHGWYLNSRLISVHAKLDRLLDQFNGLREYLYEIDPQFDDERDLSDVSDGYAHLQLVTKKDEDGRRTLNTPLVPW
jgi:hypothetical protein